MTTDTQALRELLANATPGEWKVNERAGGSFIGARWDFARADYPVDAALIVAAVNALPAHLDTIEALTREVEGLRAELDVSIADQAELIDKANVKFVEYQTKLAAAEARALAWRLKFIAERAMYHERYRLNCSRDVAMKFAENDAAAIDAAIAAKRGEGET